MKVTTYEGHKVPEGATHYRVAKNRVVYFYRYLSDRLELRIFNNDRWWATDTTLGGDNSPTELPEQEAEWVPSGRCTHKYGGGVATMEEEVTIVGIDKEGFYVYQNDKSTCYYSDQASEFRPLRTEAEKKREAFMNKAFKTYYEGEVCDRMASAMYEAGFTAPKGVE